MPRPNLPKPGIVLGLVEAWPSSQIHCGEVRATASLNQRCRYRGMAPAMGFVEELTPVAWFEIISFDSI
jgi:hypothetical protein